MDHKRNTLMAATIRWAWEYKSVFLVCIVYLHIERVEIPDPNLTYGWKESNISKKFVNIRKTNFKHTKRLKKWL